MAWKEVKMFMEELLSKGFVGFAITGGIIGLLVGLFILSFKLASDFPGRPWTIPIIFGLQIPLIYFFVKMLF